MHSQCEWATVPYKHNGLLDTITFAGNKPFVDCVCNKPPVNTPLFAHVALLSTNPYTCRNVWQNRQRKRLQKFSLCKCLHKLNIPQQHSADIRLIYCLMQQLAQHISLFCHSFWLYQEVDSEWPKVSKGTKKKVNSLKKSIQTSRILLKKVLKKSNIT